MTPRSTIDYGIDLGTTNSVVAVMERRGPRILPGADNHVTTPSAVHITSNGQVLIGTGAKARANDDPDNTATRWKRTMGKGKGAAKKFTLSGRIMQPEELSAEILKSLRDTIRERRGEEPREVVITVPAGFNTQQSKATQQAAAMAGFDETILLQEPIAAALAYGADKLEDSATWLVYDFGGGTFDASVIYLEDGIPTVVGHAGDNFLGGTDIDRDLVSTELRPALRTLAELPEHNPDSGYWQALDSKLVEQAESAKIVICRTQQSSKISVDNICKDVNGDPVDFTFTLTPDHLIAATKPYSLQTIEFCKTCLKDAKVKIEGIDRVLMVGGTSMNPWVREAIEAEFDCPLEISIDPMTVVAEGAAIFASTLNRKLSSKDLSDGQFALDVKSLLTADFSPVDFAAKLRPPDKQELPKGLTLEFTDEQNEWSSGRVPVNANGNIRTTLRLEEDEGTTFRVQLNSSDGVRLDCAPDQIVVRWGAGSPIDPPLAFHIGVGLRSGELLPILKKGSALPARGRGVVRTVETLKKGDADNPLKIPLYEGTNLLRSTRNAHLVTIEVNGKAIPRDIPPRTEVEVILHCDAKSRALSAQVFFPTVDELLVEASVQMDERVPDIDYLRTLLNAEERRITQLRERVEEIGEPDLLTGLKDVEAKDNAQQIRRQLDERRDADGLVTAEDQIRRYATDLDEIEDELEYPSLVADIEEWLELADQMFERQVEISAQDAVYTLRREVKTAREERSLIKLRQRLAEIKRTVQRMRESDVEWWLAVQNHMEDNLLAFEDQDMTLMLFRQSEEARKNNDFDALKAALRQLIDHLPQNASMDLNVGSNAQTTGVNL
ncbi:MAG: Hsp70 family protein [Paracoccaceae bacterium]